MRIAPVSCGSPDRDTTLALHRLLALVMRSAAPGPETLTAWSSRERYEARRWADRELERYTIGTEGCPSLRLPDALVAFLVSEEIAPADDNQPKENR